MTVKERIMDTSSKLFYSKGIKATGIDTIIKNAGVAKMSFYNHFPSKHDLVMEYLKRQNEEWFGWFSRWIAEKGKGKKGVLLAVFDALQEWFEKPGFHGCPFINTALETADHRAPEFRFSSDCKRGLMDYFEELAKADGYSNTKKIAERILLLAEGAIIRSQMTGSSKPAKVAKEMACLMLENERRVSS